MPNTVVPATAGGMPKFDRRAIMLDAWKHYRWVHGSYAKWQIERGIVDGSFAHALKVAWRAAKKAVAEQAIAYGPNGQRVAELRGEIPMLSYKSLRYDITPMRRELEAQIAALAA